MTRPMRIVVVDSEPSLSVGGALHRGLQALGHDATFFDVGRFMGGYVRGPWLRATRRALRPALKLGLNLALVTAVRQRRPDAVVVLKGWDLLAASVDAMRAPGRAVVVFHPDDLENPLNTNAEMLAALPRWDAVFTPRRFALDELRARGVTRAELLLFGYDPDVHHPALGAERFEPEISGKATFVGAWAPEREAFLEKLAPLVPLTVYGTSWDRLRTAALAPLVHAAPLFGDALNACFHESGANLSLLRKANRDLHQMRSFEVPACGGLLLAERTVDHQELFEEGVEALFFDGPDECAALAARCLADRPYRRRIAEAGHQRLLASGHTYRDRAARIAAVASEVRS